VSVLKLNSKTNVVWSKHESLKDYERKYQEGPLQCPPGANLIQQAHVDTGNKLLCTRLVGFMDEQALDYSDAHKQQHDILELMAAGPNPPDLPPAEQALQLFQLLTNNMSLILRMETITALISRLHEPGWFLSEYIHPLPIGIFDADNLSTVWQAAFAEVTCPTTRTAIHPKTLRKLITAVAAMPTTIYPIILPNTALWHTLLNTGQPNIAATATIAQSTVRTAVQPHLRDALINAATGWGSPDYKRDMVIVLREDGAPPINLPHMPPTPTPPPAHPPHQARRAPHALASQLALMPRRTPLQDATFKESLTHLTRAELLEINQELSDALLPELPETYHPPLDAPSEDGSAPAGADAAHTVNETTLRQQREINALGMNLADIADTQASMLITMQSVQQALARSEQIQQREIVVSQATTKALTDIHHALRHNNPPAPLPVARAPDPVAAPIAVRETDADRRIRALQDMATSARNMAGTPPPPTPSLPAPLQQPTTRAPPHEHTRVVKPGNEPVLKLGSTNVLDFFNRTEKFFALARIPADEQIDRTLLNITSPDVTNRWEAYAAHLPAPATWETFKQQIMIYTRGHSAQHKALDALATCKQGTSGIDEYITRYSRLVTQAAQDSNAAHIIQAFIRGVSDDTFRTIISLSPAALPWESLTAVQTYASQLAVTRYPAQKNHNHQSGNSRSHQQKKFGDKHQHSVKHQHSDKHHHSDKPMPRVNAVNTNKRNVRFAGGGGGGGGGDGNPGEQKFTDPNHPAFGKSKEERRAYWLANLANKKPRT
jgi:Retrotransposon gag protein